MHFHTFRLQPPHALPSSGDTSCSGRAWPPICFRLSAVLRISFTARSLISRIRPYRVCVAGVRRPSALRTVFSFPVALHIPSPVCSYFQLVAGSTTTEGLSPSNARSLSSARARTFQSAATLEYSTDFGKFHTLLFFRAAADWKVRAPFYPLSRRRRN